LLLVAWKAPAGVLGDEVIFVANEMQHVGSHVSRLGALNASFFPCPAMIAVGFAGIGYVHCLVAPMA
jgi:hypothetical protein